MVDSDESLKEKVYTRDKKGKHRIKIFTKALRCIRRGKDEVVAVESIMLFDLIPIWSRPFENLNCPSTDPHPEYYDREPDIRRYQ